MNATKQEQQKQKQKKKTKDLVKKNKQLIIKNETKSNKKNATIKNQLKNLHVHT